MGQSRGREKAACELPVDHGELISSIYEYYHPISNQLSFKRLLNVTKLNLVLHGFRYLVIC